MTRFLSYQRALITLAALLPGGCGQSHAPIPSNPGLDAGVSTPMRSTSTACGDLTCDGTEFCIESCYAGGYACAPRPASPVSACEDFTSDPCVLPGFGGCAIVREDRVQCACGPPVDPAPEICSPSPSDEPPPGECACGFEWLPRPENGQCYACLACPECAPPELPHDPTSLTYFTLSWKIQGGDSGSGPFATVDGQGWLTIHWDHSDGRQEPEIRQFVGTDATRELYARILAVDFARLPHLGNRAECTVDFAFFPCGPHEGCAPNIELRYGELRQVMPELHCIAQWFERFTDGQPWLGACDGPG